MKPEDFLSSSSVDFAQRHEQSSPAAGLSAAVRRAKFLEILSEAWEAHKNHPSPDDIIPSDEWHWVPEAKCYVLANRHGLRGGIRLVSENEKEWYCVTIADHGILMIGYPLGVVFAAVSRYNKWCWRLEPTHIASKVIAP